MAYVGQIISVGGKPQIVEKVENGLVVSRPAQTEELRNRSIPTSIDPQYNPNLPQNQSAAPTSSPQEVKVLGGLPAGQDVATMYAEGYEYKGQEGNQQVWKKWQTPKQPGTYTSPAGDTWRVAGGYYQVMQNNKPVATFSGGQRIYYTTKPSISYEGVMQPKQATQTGTTTETKSIPGYSPTQKMVNLTGTYGYTSDSDAYLKQAALEAKYRMLSPDERARLKLKTAMLGSPLAAEYWIETATGNVTAQENIEKEILRRDTAPTMTKLMDSFISSPAGVTLQGAALGGALGAVSTTATGSRILTSTAGKAIQYGGLSLFVGGTALETASQLQEGDKTGAGATLIKAGFGIAGFEAGKEAVIGSRKMVIERLKPEREFRLSEAGTIGTYEPETRVSEAFTKVKGVVIEKPSTLGRLLGRKMTIKKTFDADIASEVRTLAEDGVKAETAGLHNIKIETKGSKPTDLIGITKDTTIAKEIGGKELYATASKGVFLNPKAKTSEKMAAAVISRKVISANYREPARFEVKLRNRRIAGDVTGYDDFLSGGVQKGINYRTPGMAAGRIYTKKPTPKISFKPEDLYYKPEAASDLARSREIADFLPKPYNEKPGGLRMAKTPIRYTDEIPKPKYVETGGLKLIVRDEIPKIKSFVKEAHIGDIAAAKTMAGDKISNMAKPFLKPAKITMPKVKIIPFSTPKIPGERKSILKTSLEPKLKIKTPQVITPRTPYITRTPKSTTITRQGYATIRTPKMDLGQALKLSTITETPTTFKFKTPSPPTPTIPIINIRTPPPPFLFSGGVGGSGKEGKEGFYISMKKERYTPNLSGMILKTPKLKGSVFSGFEPRGLGRIRIKEPKIKKFKL